jgi:hypothetical protein
MTIVKPRLAGHRPKRDWHRECSEMRLDLTKPPSATTPSMPANGSTTEKQYSITRPRAPGWLSCELCERPASRPHRRLRLTLVRHNGDDPSEAIAEHAPSGEAANPATLVLLCSDCCALIVGSIDEDEWRRRTIDSLTITNRPQLPPPHSTTVAAEVDSTQITSP